MSQVDDDIAAVAEIQGTFESALAWIQGENAREQAAIDQALANGATPAQLQPLTDKLALAQSKAREVAAAINANAPNPAPPQTPAQVATDVAAAKAKAGAQPS